MDRGILVLGGGVAGLSAAVELARRGFHPTLLEERHYLGGRAHSFRDVDTKEELDNGPHILMTCYRRTMHFLETIGTHSKLDIIPASKVLFREPPGRDVPLRGAGNPANWPAWIRCWLALAGRPDWQRLDHRTVEQWLDGCGQPEKLRRLFHRPLALAALNQDPHKASAACWVGALRRMIVPGAGKLVIPAVSLRELFVEKSRLYLEARGGVVKLNQRVEQLCVEAGRVRAVRTSDGKEWQADFYISALPPRVLWRVLPEAVQTQDKSFSTIKDLSYSSICSVYLWMDHPLVKQEVTGCLDTRIQWIFQQKDPSSIAVVISAADDLMNVPKEGILQMVCRDLTRLYPQFEYMRVLRAVIVKEKEATIDHTVGQMVRRPQCRTSLENLLLAGDWVQTGLPATIESAVQSAHTCVDAGIGRMVS